MSDALRAMAADIGAGGAGLDALLAPILGQLRNIRFARFSTVGAALTAGVKALRNLSDGSNNTLRITARLAGEDGNNIRVKTTRIADTDSAGNALFDLEVYYPDNSTLVKKYSGVSMVDTSPRYVETVVGTSDEYITVLDLDSATVGDVRPSNGGPTQINGTAGANEKATTGGAIKRGDNIYGGLIFTISGGNITSVDVIDPADINVTAANKIVSVAGIAADRMVVLGVLPK